MNTKIPKEENTNLILQDISFFIEKYTRFMSKNIYINYDLYHFFFKQYQYLYDILEKEKLLYINNPKYQKIITFQKHKDKFIKMHNKKYLQSEILKYEDFFNNLYPKDILDMNKRNVILSEEQKMLFITPKNQVPLIVGKIKYLKEILKYKEDKIIVLGTNSSKLSNLKQELLQKKCPNVKIFEIEEYKKLFLKKEIIIDKNIQYQILKDYLIKELFPKKEEFKELYHAFPNAIYLNKDYKEFDTFSDYHNYMYKRKYLSSGLSLKKFNEEEIIKRRNYLRTICNEVTNSKEEVDIANFLFLNNIPYTYNPNISKFLLYPEDKNFEVFYTKKENNNSNNSIYLNSNNKSPKNILEVLVYEIIKRRYPMEKRNEDEIYTKLKETTQDSYFNSLITNYFIPIMKYFKKFKKLDQTNLTKEQIEVFQKVYSYYESTIKNSSYIEEDILYKRVANSLNKKNYQYIIIWNHTGITPQGNFLRILEKYEEEPFIKENIKLSLEYKKYLTEHQSLPCLHAFLDLEELHNLTNKFLKLNLNTINESLSNNPKKISIYSYNDHNRLLIFKEIREILKKITQNQRKETIQIGLRKQKDINLLIDKDTFTKIEKNTLITKNGKKIQTEEIPKIEKLSDVIILPYLVADSYHENILDQYYEHKMKTMLFIALSKCKKEICLLCPKSKIKELQQTLTELKNVFLIENV